MTVTARVVAFGVLAPAGTVSFALGGEPICVDRPVLPEAGGVAASCDVPPQRLTVGDQTITAVYSGDVGGGVDGSSARLVQRVVPASTTVTLTSTPDPSVHGQPLVLRATVAGVAPSRGTPTGRVQFTLDGEPIGAEQQLDTDGQATLNALTNAPSGPLVVAARYYGDVAHLQSEAAETHVIVPAETETTIATSADPSVPGEPVTFTARVRSLAPGFGTPVGSVHFHLAGEELGRQLTCPAARAAGSRAVRTDRRGQAAFTLPRPPAGADPAVYRVCSPGHHASSLPVVVRAR